MGSVLVSPSIEKTNLSSTRCAEDQNQVASPATNTHFWHYPKKICHTQHPDAVQWTFGCSIHRGVWDMDWNVCHDCEWQQQGNYVPTTSLRQTIGYPGDAEMLPAEVEKLIANGG
jgi:hypothetical protein